MTTTVITDAGLKAAVNAKKNGLQIEIGSFQIGSSVITPLSSMSAVTGQVYVGTPSQISYVTNTGSGNTMTFIINLDQSVGNFLVGNIGLFLTNGVMFSLTSLTDAENKISTDTSASPPIDGNNRSYSITIALINGDNLINVTSLTPAYASLPSVPNETDLPSFAAGPYNAYIVDDYTKTGVSSLAISNGLSWVQIRGIQNTSDSAVIIPGVSALGLTEGTAISWNGTNIVPWDPSTENVYIGILGTEDLVYRDGIFTISTGTPYTVGTNYYCGTGANSGILTSTPPSVALNNDSFLIVGYAVSTTSLLVNAQCSQFLASLGNNYFTDTSSTVNTVDITFPTSQSSLFAGYSFRVLIANSNTGAVTLTSNLGSHPLVLIDAENLQPGNIVANGIALITWTGTQFQLNNPNLSWLNGTESILTDIGILNELAATLHPSPTSYSELEGIKFTLIPANSNTGAATLNINALGAIPIYQNNSALAGGELLHGVPYEGEIHGSFFYLLGSGGGTVGVSSATNSKHAVNFGQLSNGTFSPYFSDTKVSGSLTAVATASNNAAIVLDGSSGGGNKFTFYSTYNTPTWGFVDTTSGNQILTGDSSSNITGYGLFTNASGFYLDGNTFFSFNGNSTQLNIGSGTSISAPKTGGSISLTAGSGSGSAVLTGNNLVLPGTLTVTGDQTVSGTKLSIGYQNELYLQNTSTSTTNNAALNFFTGSALSLVGNTYSLSYNNTNLIQFSTSQISMNSPVVLSNTLTVNASVSITSTASAAPATIGNELVNYSQLTNSTFNPNFASCTVTNGTVILDSSGSQVQLYTPVNSNIFGIRTGPSSAYKYFSFNSDGSLAVPGIITSEGSRVIKLSDFIGNYNVPGNLTFPDGTILQWGTGYISNGGGNITFSEVFPNTCFIVVATPLTPPVSVSFWLAGWTVSGFGCAAVGSSKLDPQSTSVSYYAIGR